MASECCGSKKKTILLYACSGAANVAEVADKAARLLMFENAGSMFCLAGIGAGIPNMVQSAKAADLNVILEWCPMDCAKKIFDHAGLANYVQVRVTDLGIEKQKGIRATDEQVARAAAKAREVIAAT